ncbi:MAG TPA: T9SS type A sorting domain-containing protein [Bacteroides sp.]|nr:T9SS type A sorting domain-containing protein [Bacteroides sp.]
MYTYTILSLVLLNSLQRIHAQSDIQGASFYYTDFSNAALPEGWKSSMPGYHASVKIQAFELSISKSSAGEHYTFGNLFVKDFDLRSYMTITYRATDTILAGLSLYGQHASISHQEIFALPASGEWASYTFNLSSLASESWGYDLDSIQLVFQPGNPRYSGSFEMNEILVGDTVNGKTFMIRAEQSPSLSVDLGKDTTILKPATLQLDAGNPGTIYLWSTGETTRTINVDTTGIYWVRVIGDHNCLLSDTISVMLDFQNNIQETTAEYGPRVYPNPSHGTIWLDLRNKRELERVELILLSTTGKLFYHVILKNEPAGASKEIDLKDMPAGIYLLKVVGDGVAGSQNVIVHF